MVFNDYTPNSEVVYKYTKIDEEITADISGVETLSTTGDNKYIASNSYAVTCYQLTPNGGGTTYYYYDNNLHKNTPTPVTKESGITYTWSLEGIENTYATVNSSGVVTYKNLISTSSQIATLKCKATNTATGATGTTTFKITFKNPNILETPKITYDNSTTTGRVVVTLSSIDSDVNIYYTTDGSTIPSSTSSKYTEPFEVESGTTIKAIAVRGTTISSAVASQKVYYVQQGVSGGVVTLDDREDHTWTYYAGVDERIDGGSFNTNYAGKLYNPTPRNVKITYKGGGIDGASVVAVSGTEPENQFVYYETLEKNPASKWLKGDYPYQVIANPFSKRPKKDDTYYGFNGWKIVSGAEYIQRADEKDEPVNGVTVLDLEEVINFKPLPYPEVNCISAEIEFEATWAEAEVIESPTMPTFTKGYNSYERNFWIMNATDETDYTYTGEMTVTAQSPDGGATIPENTDIYLGGLITVGSGTTKFEWIPIKNNNAINANGKNLYLGRGITMVETSYRKIYGCSTDNGEVDQFLRIESGVYDYLYFYASGSSGANTKISKVDKLVAYLGCDYDRAKNNNDNLKIRYATYISNYTTITLENEVDETCTAFIKSGTFNSSRSNAGAAGADASFYYGYSNSVSQKGYRYLEIQGGKFWNIAGGVGGTSNTPASMTMIIRIKGGNIQGSIYGSGAYSGAGGSRSFVITGGNVKGWIAGGANGTQDTGGYTNGETYIYIGGNARVDSEGSTSPINSALGGNVFGAGCGYSADTSAGEVTLGTNVVIADNAYIERGVYGGGAFGFTKATSNLYMLGGVVDAKSGGVTVAPNGQTGSASKNNPSYYADSQGGFYGGANQNNGGTVNIKMYGGEIHTGLYGGSNVKGVIANSVTMQINGGQVGQNGTSANIHGGGYGQDTKVNKNVDITLGKKGAARDAGGATIWGDVYGGSALGSVNGIEADDAYHTNVTLNAGTINGSLYGGALGNATTPANVYGPVQVTVNGGTVNTTSIAGSGAVYGCNNVNGTPKSDVTVTINGTNEHIPASGTEGQPGYTPAVYAISEVYGGGNMADYSPASEDNACKVIVNNCESSIGYVYGGGNAADVPSTDVTINGGIIGQVFGGGHGNKDASPATEANVSGDVNVLVTGGTINQVFAGSNSKGTIDGSATVKVEKSSATNACEMHVTELYGGGNEADGKAGTINIISTGDKSKNEGITDVYGGARKADVTSAITLNISGGNIGRAFGGNNVSGSVSGAIVVNVNETSTGALNINSVYGAGNQAAYTGSPKVNILNGRINENVFGGGLGASAIVTGDPVVTVGDAANNAHQVEVVGNVFGGGDAAAVEGEPTVTIVVCETTIDKDVYGGGNAAPVYSTKVYMRAGTVLGNVFGGGNGKGADNPGANVGYDHNNNKVTGKDSYGTTYVVINGGTVGTWTSETVCEDGTGGVFGGSNTKGDVWNKSTVQIEGDNTGCPMKVMDVYGAGNEAYMNGTANLEIGCHAPKMEYLFGGAKNADVMNDINLVITNGSFGKVFGGNNMGGRIYGKITVTIDETGCSPILIDELYGGGYNAPYDVNWGKYDASKDAGDGSKNAAPTVNIISFSHIGKVFGGGYGAEAIITGDPVVNIQQIAGKFDPENSTADSEGYYTLNSGNKLGSIDTVFGGGNAANINGNTYVNIGNEVIVTRADGTNTVSEKGANITGNVYGGGNQADVIGKTNVVVGKK